MFLLMLLSRLVVASIVRTTWWGKQIVFAELAPSRFAPIVTWLLCDGRSQVAGIRFQMAFFFVSLSVSKEQVEMIYSHVEREN